MRIQDEERNELWFLKVSAGKYGWKMEGKRDGPMGENRQNRNVRGGARKMRLLETMMMKNNQSSKDRTWSAVPDALLGVIS